MKEKLKKIFMQILFSRAKKVLDKAKNVIGITGSVGKTSTRMAIAEVLSEKWKVQTSSQNFNTPVGLLLSILNISESGNSLFSWTKILFKVLFQKLPEPEILVLEFGVDAPGDMIELLRICTPYTVVLTPVALAHAAEGQFQNVDAVRAEKIQLAIAAKKVIANDFDRETARFLRHNLAEKTEFFGNSPDNVLEIVKIQTEKNGISFLASGDRYFVPIFGHFQTQIFAPAILIGLQNGLSPNQIQNALEKFESPAGRGRIFESVNGGTIWDFSYNSSPAATSAVLKSLAEIDGFSRKIAVLGTMNELGNYAPEEHEKLGKIAAEFADEILFLGKNSEDFKKGVAEKKPLKIFGNAVEAGNFLKSEIRENDFVLFKGSQNGVFLEEAVKIILKNEGDIKKLCRQSENWKEKKKKFFGKN